MVRKIRSHERIDYKRCPKKWYWRWRKGYVPKAKSFGALDLGTWMHDALAKWYGGSRGGFEPGELVKLVDWFAYKDIGKALQAGAPNTEIEKARELAKLGKALAEAYENRYGKDENVIVVKAEIPLEFTFKRSDGEIVNHLFKPDLVYQDKRSGSFWLMEHKTAASISTSHLVIDDQARPYVSMAERALIKTGFLKPDQHIKGIMYNFIRKAMPDTREMDAEGYYINKNGNRSKRQPPAYFLRHPVIFTKAGKAQTLSRLSNEVALVTMLTDSIRNGNIKPKFLPKTPHKSCPRFCEFFTICTAEEDGIDTTEMEKSMYVRQNPYEYPETTDEYSSFEMG